MTRGFAVRTGGVDAPGIEPFVRTVPPAFADRIGWSRSDLLHDVGDRKSLASQRNRWARSRRPHRFADREVEDIEVDPIQALHMQSDVPVDSSPSVIGEAS